MKRKCAFGGTLILLILLNMCGCSPMGMTKTDAQKEADMSKAVYVALEGDRAVITAIGDAPVNTEIEDTPSYGLKFSDGVLHVGNGGDYVLSGNLLGQVRVETTRRDIVHLILDGVSITCENSSAIYGVQSDRIDITLAADSENLVTDAAEYVCGKEDGDEPDATIFSRDDLTFNGTGSLVVKGNFTDGIHSKDNLVIADGSYEVTAVKDALQGKDSVTIKGGNFVLTSGGDAIKASNDTEEDKGYVIIDGGTFLVRSGDDGIHGESRLLINDCKLDIAECYEGLEAKVVEINGGEITVTSSDDGINAAYTTSEEADAGEDPMFSDAECKVGITGGKLIISADGDGIDSNGYLYVSGGEVYVQGAPVGADAAIDCGIEAIVTGGTVLAVGQREMSTGFSDKSTQCFIFYNTQEQALAGEMLQLKDKEGNVLFSYTPSCAYNSVLLSHPAMEADADYTIICGEREKEITLEGNAYSEGGFGGRPDFDKEPGKGAPGGFMPPPKDRELGQMPPKR